MRVYDALRELTSQLTGAEQYLAAAEEQAARAAKALVDAKATVKQAREEHSNMRKAVFCLKQAGFLHE